MQQKASDTSAEKFRNKVTTSPDRLEHVKISEKYTVRVPKSPVEGPNRH